MVKLSLCRICLNENVQHIPESTQLQEMYEKLTTKPKTDMRPLSLCYICRAQLKASRRLMLRCLKAEEILTYILNHLLTLKEEDEVQIPILIDRSAIKQLSISSVEQIHFNGNTSDVDVKVKEVPTFYEVDVKLEAESPQDLQEIAINIDSEPCHEQCSSESEDDTPLKNIKKNIETVRDQMTVGVGREERNGSEEGAPIAKKPKLKPELYNSTKDMRNIKADTTNNVTINNDAVNYFKYDTKRKHDKNMKKEKHDNIMRQKKIVEKSKLSSDNDVQNNFVEHNLKQRLRNEKNFNCDICEEGYNKKDCLIAHLLSHTAQKPYICNVKNFIRRSTLKKHARKLTGEKPYVCDVCNKSFSKRTNLRLHAHLHTGEKPYVCNVCNKSFSDKGNLKVHARIHTGEKQPYVCDVCNKSFSKRTNLRVHARLHTGEKPYVCNVCNKSFSDKGNLKVHARIHTGEKPYACNVCNKRFRHSSYITKHALVHTGERPNVCKVCNKGFKNSSDLTSHARIHRGEKPYVCNVCNKGCINKSTFIKHARSHTGEKPYVCNICNKSFSDKGNLKVHARIHTGEIPYICNVCDRGFKHCSDLTRHARIHKSERPYVCNVCNKGFNRKSQLTIHARRHTD